MGDYFTKSLWEEEPDFAKDERDEQGEDGRWQYEDNGNYYGAQHVIALVDCHPDMFQKRICVKDDDDNDDDNEPAAAIGLSIKLIQTLLMQTIEQTVIRKTGKRNGVGLLLYNIKTRRDDEGEKDGRTSGEASDNETDNDDDRMDDEDADDDDDDDKMDDEDADDSHENKPTQQQTEKTVHRLLDLKPPGIKHVQTLRKLLVDKQEQQRTDRDMQAEFCPLVDDPDPTIASLQTALEESTRMFLNAKCVRDPTKNAKRKNEYDTKSIWIFTNQANPYSDEKKQLIQNIANEAKEQRIGIIIWPLSVHSHSNTNNNEHDDVFVSPFFESISSEVLSNQRLRSYIELHDGLEEIYRTMAKKRRTYYGPLHILRPGQTVGNNRSVEDPAIMIDWYSVVQLSRRPGKVQIDTTTKKETIKIRLTLEKDTGKDVVKFWTKPTAEQRERQRSQPGVQRFRQFFNLANELVPITPNDMKKMNENANGGYAPGLTILGFKPRDSIPSYHCVLKTLLIFPNDTEIQGSENAFMHLHSAMLRKNVLALGEALHRESSQSRLVAIYAFEETDHLPPGMYVTSLPFEDDMRKIAPDAGSIEVDLQRKQEFLTSEFHEDEMTHPDRSENGKFVGVKREESNEVVNNDILFSESVNHKNMTGNKKSEELNNAAINLMSRQSISSVEIGEDFENAALTEFYSYLKSVAFDTTKEENNYDTIVNKHTILKIAGKEIDAFRSCLPIDVERPKVFTSRKRIRKTVPDDSGIDWVELYRIDEIGMCKVDLLKKYLRSVGLPTSGRKDDLVRRVTKSLEEKFTGDDANNIKKEFDGTFMESL